MAVIDDMRVDLFNGAIEMAEDSWTRSYLYIPQLNQSFSALEFSEEKLEYELAHGWAVKNDPKLINKGRKPL